MGDAAQVRKQSTAATYGLWAEVYDEQPNPMLSLESRIVSALLPELQGKDVLDLGCGTGRWLSALAHLKAATLTGLDLSPEMLERAALKLGSGAKLYEGDCSKAALEAVSADFVIASFLVSHLSEPDALFKQIARVLREGGTAFVSDLHPRTVKKLNWTRSFRHGDHVVALGTENWDLSLLKRLARRFGLDVVAEIEARFGEPELRLMRQCGRTAFSERALEYPAIYVLQLQRAHKRTQAVANYKVHGVSGAKVALTPTDSIRADLSLGATHITGLGSVSSDTIDASDLMLLPGLINSHDHLEFSLFPRLGRGHYQNAREWYDDIHKNNTETIARFKAVPKSTRVWFGGLRNLLCGVTMVCHHNPLPPDAMVEDFPVRVLRDYGWAHSVTLDPQFQKRHRHTPANMPFLIHAAEGTNAASRSEFQELLSAGILDDRTVLIHGLALDSTAVREMNRRRSSLVWCPSSNSFLFGRTHSAELLRELHNLALGSDSPLTSEGDLLDEIRFAHKQAGHSPESLYRQVTTDAARVLRLSTGAGQIRVGAPNDVLAIRTTNSSPAQALVSTSYRDVHLVIRAGRVQLASSELMSRIPKSLSCGLRPVEIDGTVRWVRAPLSRLFRSACRTLGKTIEMNGRRLRNVSTDWF